MKESDYIIYLILISFDIVFFLLGYSIGRTSSQKFVDSQRVFFQKDKQFQLDQNEKITIDQSKYVTNIDTTNMEKRYEELGETKKTNESIESSINKLKNLKR